MQSKVCRVCGWYLDTFLDHSLRCRPVAGRRADELIQAVKPHAQIAEAGKLGYGTGVVYFQLDDDTTIRFDVGDRKRDPSPFRLGELWMIDGLSPDEARDLTVAVANWRRSALEKRKERK